MTVSSPGPDRPVHESWHDPLAAAFRRWGYLAARVDALGRIEPTVHPDLADLLGEADPAEADRWRETYCGSLGVEFMHLVDRERAFWIAERLENPPPAVDRDALLRRLAGAEVFERFLQKRYVGSKRYSLEGAVALVPLLDTVLDASLEHGCEYALLGMSHRGRLTVMVSVVGIPPRALFAGLEDVDPKSVLGGGDVKYHMGATGVHGPEDGKQLKVHLVSNPSHLEAVNPVLMGRAFARQFRLGHDGKRRVLPICLHGDAAFSGQGITAETLNMADLPGYGTGGTVHVVVNNLIGFTAEPKDLHSARFSSDTARRLSIPVLRVNGEDPEAVVRAARIATEYRFRFASDVVIDLIGYRRYGHSEVEDPTTTSPVLYREIAQRPLLWESYAERIGGDSKRVGTDAESLDRLRETFEQELRDEQEAGRAQTRRPVLRTLPTYWEGYVGGDYDPGLEVPTAVDPAAVERVAAALRGMPAGFHVHPKLEKVLTQRQEMLRGERRVDFGTAEALALGTLLDQGVPVRFSGQDSRRGTFNHRHAVLKDAETGQEHVPLQHIHAEQGRFSIVDSPLSEAAVLGFEYGFSRDYPEALVCWEAQFGDFANGAQIVIDQFVTAAEDKWGLLSGLVLLLPHGYEGQGPEHSSARIERFLQLAAEHNIQVCQPSNAAQYFHLLRRQALRKWRKPLVVFTPKGMLRTAASSSPLDELRDGAYHPVLVEPGRTNARRILLCSGKIAHELRAQRAALGADDTTVVCLAQLYPFPANELHAELRRHPKARDLVWVQEEPANMGALAHVRPQIERLAGGRHVRTVKRRESASPATGSPAAHRLEQAALLRLAFS